MSAQRIPRFVAALAILPGAIGCSGGERPTPERVFVPMAWDTAWTWVGDESDTLGLTPFRVVADEQRLYVLDGIGSQLVAFDATSGSPAWQVGGTRGQAPGEFEMPGSISLGERGTLLVADGGNQRLTVFSRSGDHLSEIPLNGVIPSDGVCTLDDGSFLENNVVFGSPVVRIDSSGNRLSEHALPWPDAAQLPKAAFYLQFLPHRKGCVVIVTGGRGWALFRGGEWHPTRRYVEWFDVPEVDVQTTREPRGRDGAMVDVTYEHITNRRYATLGATVVGDTLLVPFEGETEDAGRVIDLYDIPSGRYLHSYRTPFHTGRMTVGGGTYFFSKMRGDVPVILAARPRPTAAD